MNALVMYDHQTDTLWSQFLSKGVEGPLKDAQLSAIPRNADQLAGMEGTPP